MKIGFAVTAYDKFEEASLLFAILRDEFQGNYPISFCSNHPDAKSFAKKENVDVFTQGHDYRIPSGPMKIPSPRRTSIVLRSTETVQKSCLGALSMDVDYVIHMHADAWVLNEKKLNLLAQSLKEKNKRFAIRGIGFSWMGTDTPLGHIDDHFFLFHREFAKDRRIFEFNAEEFWPHKMSVHGIIATNLISKAGLANLWYYRHAKDLVDWDGRKKSVFLSVKPSSYDELYGFLHLHRQSFPEDYGAKIQAMYLKEAGFRRSKLINDFLSRYWIEKSALMRELGKIETDLNSRLSRRLYFLANGDSREFIDKQRTLENYSVKDSLCWLAHFIKSKIKKTPKYHFLLNPVIYPKKISRFYGEDVNFSEILKKEVPWAKDLED